MRVPKPSSSCCWLLLLTSLSFMIRTSEGNDDVSTGGFVDTDECHEALFAADEDGDRRIVGDEYVNLVQILGPPGFAEDADSFEELPRILRQSFNLLACLCSLDQEEECCLGDNAFISNEGTAPGETPSQEQGVYLFSVCLTTERSIQRTIGTTPPTETPSGAPTVTPEPSLVPTSAPISPVPTDAPITPAPITPAPVTPAPVTPAPITPAPVTPAPITPAPITPAPITPAPVTPAPITPAPITPAPITAAPITPAPITPAPITSAPVTAAPITPAPTTAAPITVAPVTDAPVTAAPVTDAPVTAAPVTAAPVTTLPPVGENDIPVEATYEIGFRNGDRGLTYVDDLSQAMDVLAPQVIAETFLEMQVRHRRMAVAAKLPTLVTGTLQSECPAFIREEDVCETALHSITLVVSDEDKAQAEEKFLVNLDIAIREGRLQTILDDINPAADVYIISGLVVGPTFAPSVAPTTLAPITPSPVRTDIPVEASYEIAFRSGARGTFEGDLSQAMDVLAPQVIGETFPDLRARRLAVTGQLPTVVTGTLGAECPAFITNGEDVCETALHTIRLVIDDEDPDQVEEDFLVNLGVAIREGRLQDILDETNPASDVYILSGLVVAPTMAPVPPLIPDDDRLSSGATAGIAIGAVAFVAILAGLYIARRRTQEDKDDSYFPGNATESQALSSPDVDRDLGLSTDGTLGAAAPDYRINKSKSAAAMATLEEGGVADKAPPLHDKAPDQSSDAGSSGWSSSAGVSSLNTGSIDSIEGDSVPPGASLAAIGAASALAAMNKRDSSSDDIPEVPDVSREDLDTAIESGDWAAVGATAALLAAASDSQSYSSRSRKTDTSMSRGGSSISSMDAARAAELDHLVDAGDWEGVVVAAAKFEASEDTSTGASNTSKTGGSSGHSQASTSLSESPSKLAKRDEIREEVENLVRRVVPEEIDNVDEMMMQFKGREEELVETLRTMQERQVAQKARVQGQKQAKRDARQTSRDGGLVLPVPPSSGTGGESAAAPTAEDDGGGVNAAAAAGIGVGVAAAQGIAAAVAAGTQKSSDEGSSDSSPGSNSSSEDQSESDFAMAMPSMLGSDSEGRPRSPTSSVDSEFTSKKRRTQLELAIEAGDWEAVGEAAAMMSDASVNSASTGEIDRIAGGDTSTFSAGSSENRYQVNAERAAELDDMIDQGDWTGVVAAASRFSTADTTVSSPTAQDGTSSEQTGSELSAQPTPGDTTTLTSVTTASSNEGDKEAQLKEEQEALAQAEIWMAIANQSKTDGPEDAGASDAADWAIARSLSALKTAEAKGDLEKSESDGDGSQDTGRSV